MFDLRESAFDDVIFDGTSVPSTTKSQAAKRLFDLLAATILLILAAFCALALLLLNPFMNPGPLFYRQERMGHRCRQFTAYKFRSMTQAEDGHRGAFDALEKDRITRLGQFMRQYRIDELPQAFNVLRRDMSVIGPRPDCYDHACVYVREIPGYRERHQILPGITGLAQTQIGYVDGLEGIQRKVAADAHYIRHASMRFDLWIAWRTIAVILGRQGS
ncbi:MAG: sugar transferase [Pseudomonadota bacterium]